MSGAILGVVNFNNDTVKEEIGQVMLHRLNIYKLDRIHNLYRDNVFMGCGLLHITEESLIEVLPFHDKKRGLIITADAIIDNRKELFNEFHIDENKTISDSELILKAYEKWGSDCPKYLIGDFAFAIWDEKKEELFCARDHVGKRTLYYYQDEKKFAFSTLMKPLFHVMDKKVELNEKWITEYLCLPVPHEIGPNDTIYENIHQVPPATSFKVTKNGIERQLYWNPLELPKLNNISDEECLKLFKDTFFEAVSCRLRGKDEVGILLSGGLDSASVASAAAILLKDSNKKIKGYTSIPISSFNKKDFDDYFICDEREYVNSILEKYDNIECEFNSFEGEHALTHSKKATEILEQPYKTIENMNWYLNFSDKAYEDNCRVLLDGQYGNATISYGNFSTFALTMLKEKKIKKLFGEINDYSKQNEASKVKLWRETIAMAIPYKLRKRVKELSKDGKCKFITSPIKPELIEKWCVEKSFEAHDYNPICKKFRTWNEQLEAIINPANFTHIGAIETKVSLYSGIIKRDPTKDKRIIELCLTFPYEQFVRDGKERMLIRRSMEGILPNSIRLNFNKRGLQSADWVDRLVPNWEEINNKIDKTIENEAMDKYFDIEKLKKFRPPKGSIPTIKNDVWIKMFLISIIFSDFLKEQKLKDIN